MLRRAASLLAGPLGRAREASFLTKLADGNLGETALHRAGTLVGQDGLGNKYYENNKYQVGRHRWVAYADQKDYSASTVPREWHSWLHHITDAPPTRVAQYVPVYAAPAQGGVAYGTPGFGRSTAYAPQVHLPQGHLKRGRRSWARFEAWAPN